MDTEYHDIECASRSILGKELVQGGTAEAVEGLGWKGDYKGFYCYYNLRWWVQDLKSQYETNR